MVCNIRSTRTQYLYSPYTSPLTLFNQHYLPLAAPTFYNVPPIQNLKSTSYRNDITYNIPVNPPGEYRGFGYRTDYTDGATSTVFYITGPEASNLQSLKDFPIFKKTEETVTSRARSLASDITDKNAVPNAQVKIQNILETKDLDNLFKKIMPGIISFYNYPAGTVPLHSVSLLLNETNTNVTEATTPLNDSEIAPSVINVDDGNPINENNIITTTTTTEKTTETSSELSDSVVIEARENNEEDNTTTDTASST